MRLAAASLIAALLAAPMFALAQTSTAPAPAGRVAPPPAATAAPSTTPAAPIARRGTGAATPATATPAGSADEATAKQKCGADSVVWANPGSKVFHTSASRYYGKTKKGSFMCQKDAEAAGFHASKSSAARAKKPAA